MYTFNTQQASYQFWRGPCDACAADHVINSSRPSASVFPPPHLISTRNAQGAEEAEGLGTRLHHNSLVPRPSASSAPCALRVIIKCGGGKTEAEGLEEFIT